jgi:ribosome-binding protein aMBF1 (putative translation factor)
MNLQIINSIEGKPEFILLPVKLYEKLPDMIKAAWSTDEDSDYVPFVLEDYIGNPVALARLKAHVRQEALAKEMGVSQAYISQLEIKEKVTPKTLEKVHKALEKLKN